MRASTRTAHPSPFLAAWETLSVEIDLNPDRSRRLGLELERRHDEPQRHYHTTRHIEAVLGHLDRLNAATPVARLAAFFHDAIYDPTRADNEERSAALVHTLLRGTGVTRLDDVEAIVLATRDHTVKPESPDGTAAFLDADLAILGTPTQIYDHYVTAIRAEYGHLPDQEFRVGRKAVLNRFLERPMLYLTAAGRDAWEASARANLRRELVELD